MRKRHLTLPDVVVLVAGVALAALAFWPEGIASQARIARVRGGMTEAEVTALLGGPPGDYTRGVLELESGRQVGDIRPVLEGKQDYRSARWAGDEGVLYVAFDEGGRVAATQFTPGYRSDTLVSKLRRWLGF